MRAHRFHALANTGLGDAAVDTGSVGSVFQQSRCQKFLVPEFKAWKMSPFKMGIDFIRPEQKAWKAIIRFGAPGMIRINL